MVTQGEIEAQEMGYLGRIVSKEGSRMDLADTVAVTALKDNRPTTVGESRKTLGLLSYYRPFIKDFLRIACPLYGLIKNDNNKVQTNTKGRRGTYLKGYVTSSSQLIEWTKQHQETLEKLIDCHVKPPVLGFPDFTKAFVLHTDASNLELGAVLYQHLEGKLRVIAYGLRTLTKAEQNYHLHSGKLEFLALKWAVTEKFRDYLYYAPTFTVYSDNNPLTYILTTTKLNATGCRWVAELADFHFTIRYRPGKENVDADVLSRLPTLRKKYTRVHRGAFIGFYRGHDTDGRSSAGVRYIMVLRCSLSKFTNMCRDQYNISKAPAKGRDHESSKGRQGHTVHYSSLTVWSKTFF